MQALLPRLADLEPLVRVRLLLAALYLRPDESAVIRPELQVRDPGPVLLDGLGTLRAALRQRMCADTAAQRCRAASLSSVHQWWDNPAWDAKTTDMPGRREGKCF